MPYITKYHSENITTSLKVDKLTLIEDDLLTRVKVLSKAEKLKIFAYKKLLANDEDLVEIYKPISKASSRYVSTTRHPRFHSDPNCKVLVSDFESYTIPTSIVKQGEEAKEKFRKWFRKNKELLATDQATFYSKLKEEFNVTERIEEVKLSNSGVEYIDNISLEDVQEELENLIAQYDEMISDQATEKAINLNGEKAKYLVSAGQQFIKYKEVGLDKEAILEILKNYLTLKNDTIHHLMIYYRMVMNPDLSLSQNLLESLGFAECPYCKSYKNR